MRISSWSSPWAEVLSGYNRPVIRCSKKSMPNDCPAGRTDELSPSRCRFATHSSTLTMAREGPICRSVTHGLCLLPFSPPMFSAPTHTALWEKTRVGGLTKEFVVGREFRSKTTGPHPKPQRQSRDSVNLLELTNNE